MQTHKIDPASVPGWAVDADPKNDPTYPIKARNNGEHAGYSWERPAHQTQTVEVLHSNERPNLSAVYGTSTPPAGLSGAIRRMAFQYSESSYGHWLPLMLADRVGVAEGVIDDLAHGHVPNLFAERGWGAEWKYNRASLIRRSVTGLLIAGAIGAGVYYLTKKSDRLEPEAPRRPQGKRRNFRGTAVRA